VGTFVNRDWVIFHLTEARDEINKTIAEIQETPDYDDSEFWVAMQHLYHHANTAWNSRNASPADVQPITHENFNRWSRFPEDLPMMNA